MKIENFPLKYAQKVSKFHHFVCTICWKNNYNIKKYGNVKMQKNTNENCKSAFISYLTQLIEKTPTQLKT